MNQASSMINNIASSARISMIVAHGKNREIGLNNKLLWHISEELKNFKHLTLNHHLIMGRKTYESIGKALPGRSTIVLTSDPYLSIADAKVATTAQEALSIAKLNGETEVFICGGGKVYRDFLPIAQTLYVSQVDYEGPADTHFPEYDVKDWKVEKEIPHEAKDGQPAWTFRILTRTL